MHFWTNFLFALASLAISKTIDCGDEAFYEGGNWFCHEAEKIVYGSIGGRGSFRDVIGMGSDGQCDKIAKYYQGTFAPLDEDVSVASLNTAKSSLLTRISFPFTFVDHST